MALRKRGKDEGPELPESEFGDGLKVVVLVVDGHPVRAMHLSQMPVVRILPIMSEKDGMTQVKMLMDLLKDSLLDPLDWETYVLPAKMESIGTVLAAWTETMDLGEDGSSGSKKKKR